MENTDNDTMLSGGDNSNELPQNETAQPSIWDGMQVSWPEGIDDSIKESNALKKHVNDKGEFNYANIMKSFVHLDRMRGNMIKLPEHLQTEEEKDRFYERVLGYKPSDLESYKPEFPEETEIAPEFYEDLREIMHKNKIPLESAKGIGEFIENKFSGFMEQIQEVKNQQTQQGIENLRQEWGQGFEKNVGYASEVVNNFGGPELKNYLNQTGLGNDPSLIKLLSNIGQKIYTDTQLNERVKSVSNFGLTPQEAQQKITDITSNMQSPYWDATHPNHNKAVDEVTKLYGVLSSSQSNTSVF